MYLRSNVTSHVARAMAESFPQFTIDIHPKHKDSIFVYECAIFSVQSSHNELKFQSRYLTPTMYFRHKRVEPYNRECGKYVFSIPNDNKNKNNMCRSYQGNGIVPIIFAKMMVDFGDMSELDAPIVVTENLPINTNTKQTRELPEYDEVTTDMLNDLRNSEFYMDNVVLTVLNHNWKTANAAEFTPSPTVTQEFFDWCNSTRFESTARPVLRDMVANVVSEYSVPFANIGRLARHEGGIRVDHIVDSTADGILHDRIQNVLRCQNQRYNTYNTKESDPVTLTLVHEMMKKHGLYTKLIINDKVEYLRMPPHRRWWLRIWEFCN